MATQVGKLKTDRDRGARLTTRDAGLFSPDSRSIPAAGAVFLHEVRVEMRQVTWPTRREVFVTTWVVMVTVAFFGVFFFGVDSSVSWLVQRMLKTLAH